jgi:probable rRNA maturation factor
MNDDPDPDSRLTIDVAFHSPLWRASLPGVARLARATARAAVAAARPSLRAAELSLVFSDDEEVRSLNRLWRGQDKPTNVLSFPAGEGAPVSGAPFLLGDVVLAFATVAREAAAQGKPFPDHVRHLVVHGVLHLFGHDHEDEAEAEAMEQLERRVLAEFGVPDPYRAFSGYGRG